MSVNDCLLYDCLFFYTKKTTIDHCLLMTDLLMVGGHKSGVKKINRKDKNDRRDI